MSVALPPGYELIRQLGQGAVGSVYLGRQVASGRQVAIKRIVGGAGSQDPETVLRFKREARLLAQLKHPGIVQVHELVKVGGDLFVVMEHVAGTDLRSLLAAGPPTPQVAVGHLTELAAALDYAHQRGVVHRDVKPSNVLVRDDAVLKLGDFGVARLLEGQARFASRGTPPGTPAYMAPELARGDSSIDVRADVYSLGVMAYEMLVGRVPFPVDAEDVYATVRAHAEQPPPRPSTLRPGFPPLLQAALLWALQKPPERRPATAGEFAAALQDALRRTPAVPAAPAAGEERPATGAGASTPRRGRARWVWGGLGAAAAVLLLGLTLPGLLGLLAAAPPPLAVTSVKAAVAPADGVGHCPHATMSFRGTISTNGGAGTVTYQWLRPDGQLGAAGRASLPQGRHETTVTLTYDYNGSGPASGVAALHVLGPADVYSPPVRVAYACP